MEGIAGNVFFFPTKFQLKIYQLWITAHRASGSSSVPIGGQGSDTVYGTYLQCFANSHTWACYHVCKNLIAAHTEFLQVWSKRCNTTRRCVIDSIIHLKLQRCKMHLPLESFVWSRISKWVYFWYNWVYSEEHSTVYSHSCPSVAQDPWESLTDSLRHLWQQRPICSSRNSVHAWNFHKPAAIK